MSTPLSQTARDKRPYKQVLDDLWARHQAPREPDAPTVVSLFAGAGGSSLGYSAAGFYELLAVEWDAHACRCLRQNFPGLTVYEGDVGKLSVERALELAGVAPGELDVLDGSPPCQGFSTAGKRLLEDPRNQLFREYVRLLEGFRPRVFVMENVSGMVKGKMKLVFAEILRTLRGAGYTVGAWLLNAMHYGVPQSRERMIFVGVRSDLVGTEPGVPQGRNEEISVKEIWPDFSGKIVEFCKGKKDKTHRYKSVNRAAPALSKCGGHIEVNGKRTHWPHGIAKMIASFPEQYTFLGSDCERRFRIGNSVPPLLMHRIASHVREAILVKLEASPIF